MVAHRVCDYCIHDKVTETSCCVTCGPNRHVFKGYNCAEEFCEWLFHPDNMNSTCIAHNFKVSVNTIASLYYIISALYTGLLYKCTCMIQ